MTNQIKPTYQNTLILMGPLLLQNITTPPNFEGEINLYPLLDVVIIFINFNYEVLQVYINLQRARVSIV